MNYILTQPDWIARCLRLGFKRRDIPALKELFQKYGPRQRNRYGRHVVVYQGIVIRGHEFSSRADAAKWARWNYKGHGGWEVLTWAEAQSRK